MIKINDSKILEIVFTIPYLSIENANAVLPLLKKAVIVNNKNIELNFSSVGSIDSSAISMLVKFYHHMMGSKRMIELTHVSNEIFYTFEVTQLTRFFKVIKNIGQ
jgi:anti-anti-sigma factor